MKNTKKMMLGITAFFTAALTACTGGGNALSEQYFEQPLVVESTMTIELLHKKESKWLDVVKQKATTVGLSIAELGAGSKDPKKSVDVYLRHSDVYNDAGEYKSATQALVDDFDLEYLVSEYYAPTEESIESVVEARREDEPISPESSENKSEEETSKESESVSSEEVSIDTSVSEEESSSEDKSVVSPLFPIEYGTKDALAAKFSFSIAKFIESVRVDEGKLFSFKVALQKYDTKTGILGSSKYTLAYDSGKISYAIPLEINFDGKTESIYAVSGHGLSFAAEYFELLRSMLNVEAKFVVTYDGCEEPVDVDLENTVFVDVEDETKVPEGAFNVYGKEDVLVKIKEK